MVTYGGMAKKPITVSTSSFIFKVTSENLFNLCLYIDVATWKLLRCQYIYINSFGQCIRHLYNGPYDMSKFIGRISSLSHFK